MQVEDALPETRVFLALRRRQYRQLVDVGAGDERLLAPPVRTIARTASSAWRASNAVRSSARVAPFSAFRPWAG